MITPPVTTKAFYSVLFEKPAVRPITELLVPVCGLDIKQVLITSLDIEEMEATNELDIATRRIIATLNDPTAEQRVKFNPLYLPISANELEETMELNRDGDVKSAGGFTDPYMSSTLKVSIETYPDLVDGTVSFQPFEIPPVHDVLKNIAYPS